MGVATSATISSLTRAREDDADDGGDDDDECILVVDTACHVTAEAQPSKSQVKPSNGDRAAVRTALGEATVLT